MWSENILEGNYKNQYKYKSKVNINIKINLKKKVKLNFEKVTCSAREHISFFVHVTLIMCTSKTLPIL